MRKVAVTGGLCSGKSTVCQVLEEMGSYVISADKIVHDLLMTETAAAKAVVGLLGKEIIGEDGFIDRQRVAKKAFKDRTLLGKLENILHPAVRMVVDEEYNKAVGKGERGLFVVEVPLLFEGSGADQYDSTVAVVADEKMCKVRYQKRGPHTDDYLQRAGRQLSQKEKAARADYVIRNDGDVEDLKRAVNQLYKQLQA